jgi:hypothetical protein
LTKKDNIKITAQCEQHTNDRNEYNPYNEIGLDTTRENARGPLFDCIETTVPNQPPVKTDLVHDLVTSINTGCAIHTLELYTVADVNTSWAYGYTLVTVNTVTRSPRSRETMLVGVLSCIIIRLRPLRTALTAFVVVRNCNGILINEGRHIPSVWTCYEASLFTESIEHHKEHKGEEQQPTKELEVRCRTINDIHNESITRDNIREEDIGDAKAYRSKEKHLDTCAPPSIPRPWPIASKRLLFWSTLDHPLDIPKDHLHKDSLRTQPTTPDPTECRCEQYNRNDTGKEEKGNQVKVIRPERHSEENKLTCNDIQEDELMPAHCYKGGEHQKCNQHDRNNPSQCRIPSTRHASINPPSPSIRLDARKLGAMPFVILYEIKVND